MKFEYGIPSGKPLLFPGSYVLFQWDEQQAPRSQSEIREWLRKIYPVDPGAMVRGWRIGKKIFITAGNKNRKLPAALLLFHRMALKSGWYDIQAAGEREIHRIHDNGSLETYFDRCHIDPGKSGAAVNIYRLYLGDSASVRKNLPGSGMPRELGLPFSTHNVSSIRRMLFLGVVVLIMSAFLLIISPGLRKIVPGGNAVSIESGPDLIGIANPLEVLEVLIDSRAQDCTLSELRVDTQGVTGCIRGNHKRELIRTLDRRWTPPADHRIAGDGLLPGAGDEFAYDIYPARSDRIGVNPEALAHPLIHSRLHDQLNEIREIGSTGDPGNDAWEFIPAARQYPIVGMTAMMTPEDLIRTLDAIRSFARSQGACWLLRALSLRHQSGAAHIAVEIELIPTLFVPAKLMPQGEHNAPSSNRGPDGGPNAGELAALFGILPESPVPPEIGRQPGGGIPPASPEYYPDRFRWIGHISGNIGCLLMIADLETGDQFCIPPGESRRGLKIISAGVEQLLCELEGRRFTLYFSGGSPGR